jgi:hypothetical protein
VPSVPDVKIANNKHNQRASNRSVFARRVRPRNAFAFAGSTSRTSKPSALSSRHTHRQPVVASIATATNLPRKGIAQSLSSSRVAAKRRSDVSPLSASNTAT